jgi:hypothetical protein
MKERKQQMFGFKKKTAEVTKPKTTTLEKYHIHFKTVDGEMHKLTKLRAANPNAIACSIPDFYMIDRKYLEDDEGVKYPINNIVSIRFELADTIENVIELGEDWGLCIKQLWYPKETIKIFEE